MISEIMPVPQRARAPDVPSDAQPELSTILSPKCTAEVVWRLIDLNNKYKYRCDIRHTWIEPPPAVAPQIVLDVGVGGIPVAFHVVFLI